MAENIIYVIRQVNMAENIIYVIRQVNMAENIIYVIRHIYEESKYIIKGRKSKKDR